MKIAIMITKIITIEFLIMVTNNSKNDANDSNLNHHGDNYHFRLVVKLEDE